MGKMEEDAASRLLSDLAKRKPGDKGFLDWEETKRLVEAAFLDYSSKKTLVPLSLGPALVANSTITTLSVIPEEILKPVTMIYTGPPGTFLIKDISIGKRSQFSTIMPVLPESFPPPTTDHNIPFFFPMDTIVPSMYLSVEVKNIGPSTADFSILFLCRRLPPPKQAPPSPGQAPAQSAIQALTEPTTYHSLKTCGGCRGTGASSDGGTCRTCMGSGSVKT